MRVIAGRFKGRRLKPPTWEGLRPTSDKLRETLFNILAPRMDGARVLDGCAGTGAVGIEALSRGAAHVTFVDRDRRATALIEANLAACGASDGYTIRTGEVSRVLVQAADQRFDLVFLDPPYAAADVEVVIAAAAAHLNPGGLLVLEHATRSPTPDFGPLVHVRDVKSGDSTLTFAERT